VYEAGHEVAAYQPETAFRILERTLKGLTIATGNTSTTDSYSTSGPPNSTIPNNIPPFPESTCYILKTSTCTRDEIEDLYEGIGIIENYILIEGNSLSNATTRSSTGVTTSSTSTTSNSSVSSGASAPSPLDWMFLAAVVIVLADMVSAGF